MARAAAVHACPVAAFQKLISGKYKLRIVWDLQDGPRRYGEIRSGLLRGADGSAEIAPRVLSRELKALTESGLLERKDCPAQGRVSPDPQGQGLCARHRRNPRLGLAPLGAGREDDGHGRGMNRYAGWGGWLSLPQVRALSSCSRRNAG